MDVAIHRIVGTEHVIPEEPRRVGLVQGPLQDVELLVKLHPHVDVGHRRAGGEAGDQYALQQLVRVLLHQHTITERTRFGLVGVDAQVGDLAVGRQERPLHPRREARPSTAAQATVLDHLHGLLRGPAGDHLLGRGVASARTIDLQGVAVLDADMAR